MMWHVPISVCACLNLKETTTIGLQVFYVLSGYWNKPEKSLCILHAKSSVRVAEVSLPTENLNVLGLIRGP